MNPFTPGKVIEISPLIKRIVAPNPGMMTGPGTNTYLIGTKELAVIDPGPPIDTHIDAVVDAANNFGGKIQWIICTHTHRDHSPAAEPLRQKTGAQVIGQPPPPGITQDKTFNPDQIWQHHDQLKTDRFTLKAIYTPGHASNHLCIYLEEEQLLFTGDHMMEGSTVVIAPPDGNMADYINSLELLKQYTIKHLAPAHGDILRNPEKTINGTIRHRLRREKKALQRLAQLQPCDIKTLVTSVYDDVPAFLHSVAELSLLAHLYKLEQEKRVKRDQGLWRL